MPGRTGRWRAIATRSRCSTSATSSGQGGAGQRPLPRLRRGECLPTLAAAARAILAPLSPVLAGVLAIVTRVLAVGALLPPVFVDFPPGFAGFLATLPRFFFCRA